MLSHQRENVDEFLKQMMFTEKRECGIKHDFSDLYTHIFDEIYLTENYRQTAMY